MSYKFDSLMMILNKLDGRKKVTVDYLKQELGVSERTIFRYLNTTTPSRLPDFRWYLIKSKEGICLWKAMV